MVTTLLCPEQTRGQVAVRTAYLPGGASLTVFTYQGVEYVKGVPADIEVIMTRFDNEVLSLKRRDSVPRANALCSIHKAYRAIRKPRTSCEQCWEAYNARH